MFCDRYVWYGYEVPSRSCLVLPKQHNLCLWSATLRWMQSCVDYTGRCWAVVWRLEHAVWRLEHMLQTPNRMLSVHLGIVAVATTLKEEASAQPPLSTWYSMGYGSRICP